MYSEMAGRHRCRPRSIQIIRTGIVAAKDTKRAPVKQFQVSASPFVLMYVIVCMPVVYQCIELHAVLQCTYCNG
jgi:hypothetical protein